MGSDTFLGTNQCIHNIPPSPTAVGGDAYPGFPHQYKYVEPGTWRNVSFASNMDASSSTQFPSMSSRRTDASLTSGPTTPVQMSPQGATPGKENLNGEKPQAAGTYFACPFPCEPLSNQTNCNANLVMDNVLFPQVYSPYETYLGRQNSARGNREVCFCNHPQAVLQGISFSRGSSTAPITTPIFLVNDNFLSTGVPSLPGTVIIGGGGDATTVTAAAAAGCSNNCVMGNTITPGISSQPQTEPTQGAIPSSYEADVDEKNQREKTLRFKMLPSPVPYDIFFANIGSSEPIARFQQYKQTMLRWYKRISKAQENARARVRQRCPSPPKSVEEGIPSREDWAEMQGWAEECCRWWDETSRKRTRRGHRGGKSLGGATPHNQATTDDQPLPRPGEAVQACAAGVPPYNAARIDMISDFVSWAKHCITNTILDNE